MRDGKLNGGPDAIEVSLAVQVATAERLADALVSGFQLCEDRALPLTELQKAALVKAALLEFDGIEADVRAFLALGAALRRLATENGSGGRGETGMGPQRRREPG